MFNIGNSKPTELPLHRGDGTGPWPRGDQGFSANAVGDVVATAADTTALEQWVGFKPSTTIEIGIDAFARWYRDYFQV